MPTCNAWVFEHEQEPIAKRGAGRLRAGKEQRQSRHDEVPMIELAAGVGLVLQPGGWGAHQGRRGLLPSPLLSGPLHLVLGLTPSGPSPFPLCSVCPPSLSLRLNLSSLCLALFQSSRISLACLSPFLSVSFCLCDSFHQLLQFSPLSCISIPLSPPYHLPTLSSLPLSLCSLTNLPSPLPAATAPLLSRPFSLRIFCSPPFHPHCLSQIPLFPCGAGSSQ